MNLFKCKGKSFFFYYGRIDWFLDHIDEILVEPAYPSLLHGDLWSGNVIAGKNGGALAAGVWTPPRRV